MDCRETNIVEETFCPRCSIAVICMCSYSVD